MKNKFRQENYHYSGLKFMFKFIKEHSKLFFALIIIFIFLASGIIIPLLLRSFDGVNAIAKNQNEKAFARAAIKEAYGFLNEPLPFVALRVKLVKIVSDVPTCNGRVIKYVAFFKGYALFNIPFIGAVIESSDIVSEGAAAGMTMHIYELEAFKRSPSDLYSCSFGR